MRLRLQMTAPEEVVSNHKWFYKDRPRIRALGAPWKMVLSDQESRFDDDPNLQRHRHSMKLATSLCRAILGFSITMAQAHIDSSPLMVTP